jgi:hypothetical protein
VGAAHSKTGKVRVYRVFPIGTHLLANPSRSRERVVIRAVNHAYAEYRESRPNPKVKSYSFKLAGRLEQRDQEAGGFMHNLC